MFVLRAFRSRKEQGNVMAKGFRSELIDELLGGAKTKEAIFGTGGC